MVSDVDIENRKLASVPKGTQLRNKWPLNVFNEWKLWRNINITFDLSEWEEQDMIQWLPTWTPIYFCSSYEKSMSPLVLKALWYYEPFSY